MWKQYETDSLVYFLEKHPSCVAYLWENVPEDWFLESGYIHDFNKERIKRLMEKKRKIQDFGTDIFYKDQLYGHFGFIQCKNYVSESTTITSNMLGTFLFMHNVLLAENHKTRSFLFSPQKNLEIRLQESIARIPHLEHVLYDNVLYDNQKKVEKKNTETIQLRPWQLNALESLSLYGFDDQLTTRALQAPCGAGKSMVIFQLMDNYFKQDDDEDDEFDFNLIKSRIVFVLAPLRVSVNQLYQHHDKFLSESAKSIKFDSDLDGTCNVNDLKSATSDEEYNIVVYITFKSFFENCTNPLFQNAVYIVDECHNLSEAEIKHFTSGMLLLVSATIPAEFYECFGIDEENSFVYSTQEAIDDGLIVENRYWVPQLITDESLSAKVTFLLNGMLKTGSRRCIAFFSSQEECLEFNEMAIKALNDFYGFTAHAVEIVDSTSSLERSSRLCFFETDTEFEFHFLSSVRILQEAVDVPKCDSVFISRVTKKSNEIRLWQSSMRGNRLDDLNPCKRNNVFLWCGGSDLDLELFFTNDPMFSKRIGCVETDYDGKGSESNIKLLRDSEKTIIDGLQVEAITLEEAMVDKWRVFLAIAERICLERGIEKSEYFPSQGSKIFEEKRLAERVSNLRQSLRSNGNKIVNKNKISEYVNFLIQESGFGHWLIILSHDEKALEKWKKVIDFAEKICLEKGIEKSEYFPKQTSKNPEEQLVGIFLNSYRTKLKNGLIFQNVNELIVNCGFGHWLRFQTLEEKSLRKWSNGLLIAEKICSERGITKSHFFPNQKTKDPEEYKLGMMVSTYRKGLSGKGNYSIYKSVNSMIKDFGFEHWLSIQSNEEIALEKFKKLVSFAENVCLEKGIQKCDFLPSPSSELIDEKQGVSLLYNYRGCLKSGESNRIYKSVNSFLINSGFGHWLLFKDKESIAVEKWKNIIGFYSNLCYEKGYDKSTFKPSRKRDIDPKEREFVGTFLSYRKAILGHKNSSKVYESVNFMIKEAGFDNWLSNKTEEEDAFEKWKTRIIDSEKICLERGLDKGQFFPSKESMDIMEKKIGTSLSNYRKSLFSKCKGNVYEKVNSLISNHGFGHWLCNYTDEEKALDKWKKNLDFCNRICTENGFIKNKFKPSQSSEDHEEKRIAHVLCDYRSALKGKRGNVYQSVNNLITDAGFGHWLDIETEKIQVGKKRARKATDDD